MVTVQSRFGAHRNVDCREQQSPAGSARDPIVFVGSRDELPGPNTSNEVLNRPTADRQSAASAPPNFPQDNKSSRYGHMRRGPCMSVIRWSRQPGNHGRGRQPLLAGCVRILREIRTAMISFSDLDGYDARRGAAAGAGCQRRPCLGCADLRDSQPGRRRRDRTCPGDGDGRCRPRPVHQHPGRVRRARRPGWVEAARQCVAAGQRTRPRYAEGTPQRRFKGLAP